MGNILDAMLVLSGWLTFFPGALGVNVTVLRTFRILRPLRTIVHVRQIRVIVESLVAAMPGVANVVLVLFFFCAFFALLGMQLFAGSIGTAHRELSAACKLNASAAGCASNSTAMVEMPIANATEMVNFNNFGRAVLLAFQCVTGEGWTDLEDDLVEHNVAVGEGVVYFYFLSLITMGYFFMSQYVIAECCASVQSVCDDDRFKQTVQRFREAFDEADVDDSGGLDFQEFCDMMRAKIVASGEEFIAADVKSLWDAIDIDGDGDISFKEFSAWLSNESQASVVLAKADEKVGMMLAPYVNSFFGAILFPLKVPEVAMRRRRRRKMPAPKKVVVEKAEEEMFLYALRRPFRALIAQSTVVETQLHQRTEQFLLGIIVLSFLSLVYDHYPIGEDEMRALEIINWMATGIFVLEAAAKIIAYSPKGYVTRATESGAKIDGSNCFDFLVTIFSIVDVLSDGSGGFVVFRTFRLLRLGRVLRSIKGPAADTLRALLHTAAASMSAVSGFAFLLMIVMYIFSLTGMQVFGSISTDVSDASLEYRGTIESGDGNRFDYSNFISAFRNIFQVVTGENWDELLYDGYSKLEEKEKGGGINAIIFYCTLLFISNYVILSLFVGTLLEKFQTFFSEREAAGSDDGGINIMKLVRGGGSKAKQLGKAMSRRSFRHSSRHSTTDDGDRDSVAEARMAAASAKAQQLEDAREERRTNRSCRTFPRTSKLRMFCEAMTAKPGFEKVVLLFIALSSFSLIFDDPTLSPNSTTYQVLGWLDMIFITFFSIEMFMQMIAQGVVAGEDAYLKTGWNVLDFIVVLGGWQSLSTGEKGVVRVGRAFRLLRPFTKMSAKRPAMTAVAAALVNSLPAVGIVMVVFVFFVTVVGVLFCQLFKGKMGYCTDFDMLRVEACVGSGIQESFSDFSDVPLNEVTGTQWQSRRRNFDNIFQAAISIFEILTLEEWPALMYTVIDATEVGQGPKFENEPSRAVFFYVVILAGAFLLLNLFVGVIVSAYNEAKANARDAVERELKSKWEKEAEKLIRSAKPVAAENSKTGVCRKPFRAVADSGKFEILILIVILLNCTTMAMDGYEYMYEYDAGGVRVLTSYHGDLEKANMVFSLIFVMEFLIKLIGYGPRNYFGDKDVLGNNFDFLIVVSSVVEFVAGDAAANLTWIRMLRIVRVARVLRVAKRWSGMRNLLLSLLDTLPYVLPIGTLIVFIFFIYTVIGRALFYDVKERKIHDYQGMVSTGALNSHANFKTFSSALKTLFRISTGEQWVTLMRDCADPRTGGSFLSASLYFISFETLHMYVLINLFMAIVLNSFYGMKVETKEEQELKPHHIKDFTEAWKTHDLSASGVIQAPEKTLMLRIVSAHGLANADAVGSSDPFAVVHVRGKQVDKTRVIDNDCDPIWNHECALFDVDADEEITITVYDKDIAGSEFLGQAVFKASQLGARVATDLALQERSERPQKHDELKVQGSLRLKITSAQEAVAHSIKDLVHNLQPPLARTSNIASAHVGGGTNFSIDPDFVDELMQACKLGTFSKDEARDGKQVQFDRLLIYLSNQAFKFHIKYVAPRRPRGLSRLQRAAKQDIPAANMLRSMSTFVKKGGMKLSPRGRGSGRSLGTVAPLPSTQSSPAGISVPHTTEAEPEAEPEAATAAPGEIVGIPTAEP